MLEIKNLTAGYGSREILHHISLTSPAGAVTVLVGANGCGKSTLLKTIAGIHPPTGGEILHDGEALRSLDGRTLAQRVAYLPQSRQIPEITAERLVLHGRFPYLSYPRRYRQADLEIARRAMADLGIEDLADRSLRTLSGGQRQKVYIAMALAQNTPIVMMDEPTNFLDIAHQMQMMTQARYLADSGKTVLLVLHDLSMALRYADHLAVMQEGNILIQGSAEVVFASGCLDAAFGVQVRRTATEDGWQYYYREGC